MRAAALGVLGLFAAMLATPDSAEAAYVRDVDLGNISVKTDTWDPSVDKASSVLKFRYGENKRVEGSTWTAAGETVWTDPIARGENFTINYRFSLYDQASIKFYGGIVDDGRMWSRDITLTGPDGTVLYSGPSLKLDTLSNLAGGNYVLSLSGSHSAYTTDYYYYYLSLNAFGGNAPEPGDVPLPGALLLFGSALAGAGVVARRRAAKAKMAA
ncbi:hypothetical protein IHV25_05750 [Phaeovibrio sulfidiphilus]|uniref:PEP-CTERM protein-sorting domain-containing protein n=1 Tax=Phaeovibrio sulfidiphilus TaxID=1220600 RepID=A0A8J6YLU7_9PROT|nr:hypothetical protein [Phaeovibrio sulfidiphilus]MBE1237150.1 hypothetical protein [Phaeovibrio sulfidiphilus]